jgi:dipeptidyl aminopeptidase/acylaminoacyl peptidase
MRKKNRRAITIVVAVLYCSVAMTGRTMAQGIKPLAVEDALKTKQFAPLTPIALSPDGKSLAYAVQDNRRASAFDRKTFPRTGLPPWGVGTDIWIQNIATGATHNLTAGQGDNWLPSWSPDGRYIAFLSDCGSSAAHLWVWDVERNELRKVTDANVRTNQIEWTQDSREVVVTVSSQGPPREGNAQELPRTLSERSGIQGERNRATVILYQSYGHSDGGKESPSSDPWDLDESLRDLVRVEIYGGRVNTLVRGTRITTYSASPDGTEIAYTTPRRFEEPGSQQILFDLNLVGTAAHQARTLASDIRLDFQARFRWSPDSVRINYREGGPRTSGDCFVVAIAGGDPQNVTQFAAADADSASGSASPLWDAKGDSVFFLDHGELWEASRSQAGATRVGNVPHRQIVRMISGPGGRLWTSKDYGSTVVVTHDDASKQDGFYRIDLRTGESARLLENGQCYTCSWMNLDVTVSRDGEQAFYFREDAQHASELWMVNRGFDTHRQLSHLNPQFESYKMGAARLIEWLSDNGKPLQGVLLLPAGNKEGARYPLITWVYGGALQSNDFDHFGLVTAGPFNMQLFATRGYAVFLPDIPVEVGTPMSDIAKAVLPGINKVIEMGIADPERLGIMGHSFGGYSTMSMIVQTKRFKAAIDSGGFGDAIGDYGAMGSDGTAFGTTVQERGPGSLGGTPWEERDKYIENSPVLYLDRVETPLLIIHGSDDEVVAAFLADEVFVDLRRLGKEVVYARYNGEDHSPAYWSYANQLDLCNRIIAWFDEHLQPVEP